MKHGPEPVCWTGENHTGELIGFAYGEDLEQGSERSLGYRLLTPVQTENGCDEIEALARRLQAAPYPHHWPESDLFCSVLLADGRRLVAMARYGLPDHTPGQRRGGLELLGVIGPGDLSVSAALSLYRWLAVRRSGEEDLHRMGGIHSLAEALAEAPDEGNAARPDGLTAPVPVLPVRLWQDGAFLFAAGTPTDPDHHLRLLEQAGTAAWQWLPLVGPDFPLPAYSQRGPLVAWTPHLAGVALKLERKESPSPARVPRRSHRGVLVPGFCLLVLIGLLGGNLWYLHQIHQVMTAAPPPAPGRVAVEPIKPGPPPDAERGQDRFARALYPLLVDKEGAAEGKVDRAALLERYAKVVRKHRDLAVSDDNERGKLAVAAASLLSGRSADRVEESVRRGLSGKGYSDKLIEAACEQIREHLAGEGPYRPGAP